LQFLHREINTLAAEEPQKRKFALIRLYEIFVLAKEPANNRVYQEMLPHLLKPLLKRLSDKVEKNRELAILILKEFFSKVEDLTLAFPYLFPVLLERLNAVNIEGTDGLPEQMMPPTAQKAQTMTEIIEPSEEVRLQMAELMSIIVSSTIPECFRAYLDDVSNIL